MSEWSDGVGTGYLLASYRFSDGIRWSYTAAGLSESGAAPRVNTPDIVNDVFTTFGDDLRAVAAGNDVPIDLLATSVCMIVEDVGAATAAHYVQYLDGFASEEETPHLAYVGCTGLRYDRAIALVGSTTIADYVADPSTAINAAALRILASVSDTHFQSPLVAAAYDNDSVYPDPLSRWKVGPQQQIDQWVAWFNTVVRALQNNPTLAGFAPSFMAILATIEAPLTPPIITPRNQWSLNRPESIDAMEAGMMAVCESNPSLSTIWALDTRTTTEIKGVANDAGSGQGLPKGLSYFGYPDRGGTMRIMNADEVQKLYRAMRDYISDISFYDTYRSPDLPGQPVFIL